MDKRQIRDMIQGGWSATRKALARGWEHPIRARALVAGVLAIAVGGSISAAMLHAKNRTQTW